MYTDAQAAGWMRDYAAAAAALADAVREKKELQVRVAALEMENAVLRAGLHTHREAA